MTGEDSKPPVPTRFPPRLGDVPYIIVGVYFAWMAITVAINLYTFWRGRSGQGWKK